MNKVNIQHIVETVANSPKGKFGCANKDISVALGRKPSSTDAKERHPFDVQICRIPSGKSRCPYHAHTAQWEFFQVISGTGTVRHKDGFTKIEKDDAFLLPPEDPHQLINDGPDDLVVYIIADNPSGEACYYPDSNKWKIQAVSGQIVRSEPLNYFDGEE